MEAKSNPVRHVVIALLLSLVTFVVAGDKWNSRIGMFKPVRPIKEGESTK